MSLFSTLRISSTGLTANRLWLDTIASNIANANTTRTPEGGPYRRQDVILAPQGRAGFSQFLGSANSTTAGQGVTVAGIAKDTSAPRMIYNPDHPDADANGYVAMPNINIVTEMVNMIAAQRAYEANVTVIGAAKSMAVKSLEI
ncbi:MAG: flagellar basal body rod protein FlgC [Candidatus Aquicultor secundus]|uniref:Flagellar basal-body rod protein FlgC n=1 Tax=Candidatus Aquicultor secundus TaxID=1973895 RepID=A0A2M7T891_9ACTN|nr:flagellar basal body rod protein FlgC [Candidatus Aquicultor secundus]NCO66678.1 flagellar basal body rod protein FlgC [Solirubrobacter sp.]OIO85618.1 MAG: flagellar basal body rod protein FlgC [Candidatus Aquicultor secundus]PIU26025.1 MAG: flagellar basal body rod protein FlgC [Candidatus Aquicultor secundus]PIW21554.1 MAG: flagellar basal body rod protein FlgC [Candidatus Aquicultor secundus]PIX52670.1 MAG: flagellar basal body rod protein FlgC [Candidatus Aquicultor secundus]